jgi:Brp/Blh family beta-carotene 15,15'-monooxygenase
MIAVAERWYGRVFLAVTALLVMSSLLGQHLRPGATLAFLVAGVILLGLPHGALDPMVARKAFTGRRGYITAVFYVAYFGLVLGYWMLWNRLPTLGLSLFLLIAAVHFGSDWERRGNIVTRCAYGCAIVTLPALRFPTQVASIYGMLGSGHAVILVTLSRTLAPVAVGIALFGAALQVQRHSRDLFELLAIMTGALLLSPLVFFTCYFTLLHSPRHLLETAEGLGMTRLKNIYLATLPVLLATLLLGAVAYGLLPHIGTPARLLRIVFIGLAALTVPHMLLDTLAETRKIMPTERGPLTQDAGPP